MEERRIELLYTMLQEVPQIGSSISITRQTWPSSKIEVIHCDPEAALSKSGGRAVHFVRCSCRRLNSDVSIPSSRAICAVTPAVSGTSQYTMDSAYFDGGAGGRM